MLLGGAAALLLMASAATAMAQTPPPAAAPVTIPPAATKLATPPAKLAEKHPAAAPAIHKAEAHPAKPKPAVKKIAAAPKKSPAKLAAAPKKPEPKKVAAATPKPPTQASYTITTTRNNVTSKTTRIVPISATAAPVEHLAALPKTEAPPAERRPAPAPAVQAASAPVQAAPAAPPHPGDAAPAVAFVSRFLDNAFRIARESNATSLQRRAELADLFAAKMDVSRIAGYTTSNELTTEPSDFQRRFRTILISYLVETYYPRLELASDPSVIVETTPATTLPDGTNVVWTTFTKSGWVSQSVKWHLQPSGDGYKIVDIYSAGASLVQMERDTFLSVMRNGGLPELMAKLDARTKSLASAAP